jgi:hypothetical protein
MDDSDALYIRFRLADSGDASPVEFRFLFDAVDELTRALIVEQMRGFTETADLSDSAKHELYASVWRLARYVQPPAQVVSIRRESPWSVLIGLPVAAVIWAMRKIIAPEILQAWNESQLKENFRRFVRDGLFMGAKEQLEATAASHPQYGNLVVDEVRDTGRFGLEEPSIELTFKRTEILQVEIKDRNLMNEFLNRIGIKPR